MVQQLDGDSCVDLHGGNETEVTVKGKPVKIKMQQGRTQETYFIETKGSRAPNAACEGEDFTFNQVKYLSSVMTVIVKVSISRMVGQYDPDDKLIMVQGGIPLKPFEMSHANKSELVFKNNPDHGTILVPIDEIPTSERKLLESVYHGEASVLKPRENSEAEEREPTILVIKEGDSSAWRYCR